MSKNIVSVYDTITKRYVEIEVSEKIRTYYNRTQWNIDDNNKSFYKHEIQFSALKGNINGEFENFQEFRTENDDVERRVIQNIKFEKLYSCLNELSEDERRLIFAIYFENKTENEVAYFLHTTQQNINKKKRRIYPYTSVRRIKAPSNLTIEYQLCKYVNHTVGMKSRQPNVMSAMTLKKRAIKTSHRPLDSSQSRR